MGASCSACDITESEIHLESRFPTDGPNGKAGKKSRKSRKQKGEKKENGPPPADAAVPLGAAMGAQEHPRSLAEAAQLPCSPEQACQAGRGGLPELSLSDVNHPLANEGGFVLAPATPLVGTEPPSPEDDFAKAPATPLLRPEPPSPEAHCAGAVAGVGAEGAPAPRRWSHLPSVGTWLHVAPRGPRIPAAAAPPALEAASQAAKEQVQGPPAAEKPFFLLPSVGTWLVAGPLRRAVPPSEKVDEDPEAEACDINAAKAPEEFWASFHLDFKDATSTFGAGPGAVTACGGALPAAYGAPMPVDWKENPAVTAARLRQVLPTSTITLAAALQVTIDDADGI